jgi:flagellin-like hook-associated protein FlgL
VTALKQAAVNAGQATSLLQVADGGMSRIGDILQRMKALAVQAQSGSVTNSERSFLDQEYQGLLTQVTDIADQTKFNGSVLLAGGAGKSVGSVGANITAAGILYQPWEVLTDAPLSALRLRGQHRSVRSYQGRYQLSSAATLPRAR